MNKKERKSVSIKEFLKRQINIKLLFISIGLGLIQAGQIILFTSGKTKKIWYFISSLKGAKSFANLIVQARLADKASGILLITVGIMLLIFLSCFLASEKGLNSYIFWSLINVFLLIPSLFSEQSLNLVFLISVTTWIYFGIIWIIKELYIWTIKDKDKVLTKLTFLWGIIIAILGFVIKE